jgi:ABC-type Na+ efflux pump permease subunit
MRAVLFLALKDLRLLTRDRAAAFFTFAFPLAIALFFGYVFGRTTVEPVQVVAFVERASPAADALVRALGEDGGFGLTLVDAREDGERAVRRGQAAGLLVVPAGYEEGLDRVLAGGGALLELHVDPSRRAEGAMLVGKVHEVAFRTVFASMSDPVRFNRMADELERSLEKADLPLTDRLAVRTALSRARASTAAAQSRATAAAKARAAGPGAAAAPGVTAEAGATKATAADAADPAADAANRTAHAANLAADAAGPPPAWRPVTVSVTELEMRRGVPSNAFAISFTQGIAWALFGAVLSFCAAIAEERDRGTIVRLLTSPMSRMSILLGKGLACFAACLGTEWFLVAVGAAVFGVPVASWPWFAAASLATAFGFTGVMMILAGGFRTQGGAQGAGRAVLLVLAMIGGGTVPTVFMPPFLRTASEVSPFKWAVTLAEGATWRGWGAEEMVLPMTLLVGTGISGLLVGAALLRRSD